MGSGSPQTPRHQADKNRFFLAATADIGVVYGLLAARRSCNTPTRAVERPSGVTKSTEEGVDTACNWDAAGNMMGKATTGSNAWQYQWDAHAVVVRAGAFFSNRDSMACSGSPMATPEGQRGK